MFLILCFDFSKSYDGFSFRKSTFFKTKNQIRLQKRALLVGRGDGWMSASLHIVLSDVELSTLFSNIFSFEHFPVQIGP